MHNLDLEFENGSHICQIYEDFSQQKAVILPFFREGLKNGEHCLLVANSSTHDDWCMEFQSYGIDVFREIDRGALKIITGTQWRGPGAFNSVIQARHALEMIRELLKVFCGVRIAGDAEWQGDYPLSAAELCHWEATADLVFEGEPVRTICQFNRKHYSDDMIHSVLRTHAIVMHLGQTYRQNPSFEASRILAEEPNLNYSKADARTIDDALRSLKP
jgi:hypothetical protein